MAENNNTVIIVGLILAVWFLAIIGGFVWWQKSFKHQAKNVKAKFGLGRKNTMELRKEDEAKHGTGG